MSKKSVRQSVGRSPTRSDVASAAEDARWIAAILGGTDPQRGYEALVRKYWRVVVGWVQPRVQNLRDAEEVAQDAFIKAFRSLPKLESHRSFLAWVLQIGTNQATDFVRRRQRHPATVELTEEGQVPESAARPGASTSESVEAELERRERIEEVLETVSRLPEKYRLVITLRYQAGLSAKEIASQLGEPEGTIRNRVFRALEKVRGMLTAEHRSSETSQKAPQVAARPKTP